MSPFSRSLDFRRLLAAAVLALFAIGAGTAFAVIARGGSPPQLSYMDSGYLVVEVASTSTGPTTPQSFSATLHASKGSTVIDESSNGVAPVLSPSASFVGDAKAPPGNYSTATLTYSTQGHSVTSSCHVVAQIVAGQVTPLLFVLAALDGGTTVSGCYAGNGDVNLGLQVASGHALAIPQSIPLMTSSGAPFTYSQLRGRIVVVTTMLTECQETCPLAEGALLSLRNEIQQQGLLSRVTLVAMTQDPSDDTPAVMKAYQKMTGLPFLFVTGTPSNVNRLWTELHVPPIQLESWGSQTPSLFFATGQPEKYNIVHDSDVFLVDAQGDVAQIYPGQPTVTTPLPTTLQSYLDAQGLSQLSISGSWTAASLDNGVTSLLGLQPAPAPTQNPSGPLKVGARAPLFTLSTTTGGSVGLAQLQARPVVVSFFASWCTACRADLPALVATVDRSSSHPELLLVDDAESSSTAKKFLESLHISQSAALDTHSTVMSEYGVTGLPVTVFLTPTLNVARVDVGQLSASEVAAGIATAA